MTNEINEGVRQGSTSIGRAEPEAGDESLHTAACHGPQRQKKAVLLRAGTCVFRVLLNPFTWIFFQGRFSAFSKGIKIMPLSPCDWLLSFISLYFIMCEKEAS